MAVITFSDTKELTTTDSRSCSNFGSTLAAVEQMGTIWQISGSLSRKPRSRVPPSHSREIMEKHTLFSKNTYAREKKAIITRPHRGLLDQITHVDVRLNDGERVREVPVDFFSV
jgi:hypothetical protein